jgi:glycerol-3-phosphate dehydrogenase
MAPSLTTDVLVIGGGATGAGVLRDAAMRGMRALLLERGDLTSGTTGRYHGLLHSGGRYVVTDPVSADECARENEILRRIIPHCIEDTGGFFVTTPWDDPAYADEFVAGCRAHGVRCEELSVREILRREPLLNPRIARGFAVRDAAADSFLTLETLAASARAYGAEIRTYHRVVELVRDGERVAGAIAEDRRTGERVRIEARIVVNAAGAWASQIGAMADIGISIVPGKGTMIALNHRVVNTVVNRCKRPDDGDIIVPIRTVSVVGTTDVAADDPDDTSIPADDVAMMLEEGEKLVPGLRRARVVRAWTGVRPLYKDSDTGDDRNISRDFKLLDHRTRDGVPGIVSIVGGKYTTFRLMAERTVDLVATYLDNTTACRTHLEPAEPAGDGKLFWMGAPLQRVEADKAYGELVCECELVTRARVETGIAGGAANVDDIRRDVRLGMGPCQGGFCTYRAAALLQEQRPDAGAAANAALRDFLQERWRGLTAIAWGDQLRQERLDELIYLNLLGVARLPAGDVGGDWLVPVAEA